MADRSRKLGFDPGRPDRRHVAETRMWRRLSPLVADLNAAGHGDDRIAEMTTLDLRTVERWCDLAE
jgi:hypothetical protein